MRRRLLRRVPALVLVLAVGCGGDDGFERDDLIAAVVERYGADADQAECIADYLVELFDADEVEVLADEGLPGLPEARWEPYLSSVATCLTSEGPG